MSQSTFISQFAVYQTCRDLDAQVKLYTEYGFVVDEDYEAVEDIPEQYFTARGISKLDLLRTKALKLPADPYMHLVLSQFKKPKTGPKWPAPYDQLGSRAHAFLVRSIETELKRIKQDFPKIKILHDPLSINRRWGRTTYALLVDPDGVFFELVEIAQSGPYFSRDLKAPPPTEKSWLHYMLNTEDTQDSPNFYKSFGLVHDDRVDFRPNIGFHPYGQEKFAKEHKDAFAMEMNNTGHCDLFRNLNDPSNMHLELLQYDKGALKDPDSSPIWPQKGIARYCFKTGTKEQDLERSRRNGHKIYIPDSKICVGWGDTEYYYFGDADGNILTSEQWHPYGYYGEKT